MDASAVSSQCCCFTNTQSVKAYQIPERTVQAQSLQGEHFTDSGTAPCHGELHAQQQLCKNKFGCIAHCTRRADAQLIDHTVNLPSITTLMKMLAQRPDIIKLQPVLQFEKVMLREGMTNV